MTESEIHRQIKYAVAEVLVRMGYMVGVEVPRPGGGFFDVYGRKGNSEIKVEIWKTNIPEWLIVRVEEGIPQALEALETDRNGNSKVKLSVSLPQYTVRPRTQQRQQLAKIDSEYVEISKLRVFVETLNSLSGRDQTDVDEYDLMRELIKTGEFDDGQSVGEYIIKAMEIGIIYRRKPGLYAKV